MEPCASVTEAMVLDGYRIALTFSDGLRGVVDLENRIVARGGVFEPLRDREFFRQVSVREDLGTIVWPNEADFCPDLLHEWVEHNPVPSSPPNGGLPAEATPQSASGTQPQR